MRLMCRVLAGLCDLVYWLSEVCNDIGLRSLGYFIHFRVYNPLDDLHWYLVVTRRNRIAEAKELRDSPGDY